MKYIYISQVFIIGNTLYPIGLLYIDYIILTTPTLDRPLLLEVYSFCNVDMFIK